MLSISKQKKRILHLVPEKAIFLIKKIVGPLRKVDEAYKGRKIEDIFSQIYKENIWGEVDAKKNVEFYSGSGSHNNTSIEYVEYIADFINSNGITSVTDIGCGDFNIGSQICQNLTSAKYTGVDIVPSLIERNIENYATDRINFICANALKDKVPVSDLLLIRQVFQHLSNEDILLTIKNVFPGFKHIIITEQQLKDEYIIKKNRNKPSGPHTRLDCLNSSVFLENKPFNLRTELVLSVDDETQPKTRINSFLIHQ
ncbi:MAG: class I SAM-dependent methyltransferase [Ferruginibacter sp.]